MKFKKSVSVILIFGMLVMTGLIGTISTVEATITTMTGYEAELFCTVSSGGDLRNGLIQIDEGPDGTLFVGQDFYDSPSQIYAVNPDGSYTMFGNPPMLDPDAVTVNSAGTIFTGGDGYIYEITPSGSSSLLTGRDFYPAAPHRLEVSPSNQLYAMGELSSVPSIYEVSPTGTVSFFGMGESITFDEAGNIYILRYKEILVQYVNSTGGTFLTGVLGAQLEYHPSGFFLTVGDGNVYLTPLDGSGQVILASGFKFPFDVTVTASGDIFVTDYFDVYRIYRVDPNEPPVAEAGEDQTVDESDLVILDGSNSTSFRRQEWDPNLVALWHMNEGSGNILYDSTPYKNHGTMIGAQWSSDGKWGNGLLFDGMDDYVQVGPNDEIFGDNPDGWSYFVWFRTSNDLENICILSDTTQDQSSAISLAIVHLNSSNDINIISTLYHIGSGYRSRSAIKHMGNYTNDKWFFVAVTVSKTANEHKLFMNGEKLDQFVLPFISKDYFNGADFRIGARNPLYFSDLIHPYITPFDGVLDEIALFNRTLTDEEIQNYFNSNVEYLGNGSGSIISYEWDFDSDGTFDYQETTTNAPDGTFDGITTHVYGDDGLFTATLRVTDEANLTDTDICNITVLNVDPLIEMGSPKMEVDIGLRVAGRKYNDVGMTLSENEKIVGYVSIERMPGSPDDQMAWTSMTLDITKTYSAVVTFTSEDPPNIGGNPTWIYIKFSNGSIQKIHHTFNVQQSKKRGSDHWNHVEPWEVDLNLQLVGWKFELDYHVSDPGSDDEHLTCEYSSQTVSAIHYNNTPIDTPDPYPSPEVNPRNIQDTIELIYEGAGTLTLEVMDDDNIRLSTSGSSTSIELA